MYRNSSAMHQHDATVNDKEIKSRGERMKAVFIIDEYSLPLFETESTIILSVGTRLEIDREFYIVENVLVSLDDYTIYYKVKRVKE
jgi:hypothetical protein